MFLLSLSLASFSAHAARFINAVNPADVIPSRYFVVFKQGVDTNKVADRLSVQNNSMKISSRYRYALNGIAVHLPAQLPKQISARILSRLLADPDIDYIEQDVRVSINAQTLPTGVDRINADDDVIANIDGVDDRVDVDIAIMDTGIDLDHPDLNLYRYTYCSTQTTPPYQTTCTENDSNANDVNGHGTHVAGIAAALDNNTGVVGVAPGARLWAIKILDDNGDGIGSDIIAGVEYVIQHAAEIEVVNMSLRGNGSFTALDDAIQSAIDAGVVFSLAAGNDSKDVDLVFPAGHPNAITVSALDDYDGIAGGLDSNSRDDTFANYSNFGAAVDIMAPGTSIRSTLPDGGYGYKSGTSMASPHIAGAAALYMSQNPTASPAVVKSALLSTVDAAPCANNASGICGAPEDPDGIQEPLILLSCYDEDKDGICTDVDNCPAVANTLQVDTDLDLSGDACDNDDDNDGLSDALEAGIGTDPLSSDSDGDGLSDYDEVAYDGDAGTYTAGVDLNPLSDDSDGDGVLDAVDIEPLSVNLAGDVAPPGAPDGVLNAADLLIQTRYVQGELAPSSLTLQNGDLYPTGTPDGVISLPDLILQQQLILQQ